MSNQSITDNGDLRKYRTEIPNMADDDLDPFQYRLYAHYKRVCGANGGECYESVRSTAEKTRMSNEKVISTRQWLADNGWIELTQGPKNVFHVTIIDRWPENFVRYIEQSPRKPLEIPNSLHEDEPPPLEIPNATVRNSERSPLEISNQRKNQYKKEPYKKTTTTTASNNEQVANGGSSSGSASTSSVTASLSEPKSADTVQVPVAVGTQPTQVPVEVRSAYQANIGNLTPLMAKAIQESVKIHGSDSVVRAIGEAAKHNVLKWSYVEGVLKKWGGSAGGNKTADLTFKDWLLREYKTTFIPGINKPEGDLRNEYQQWRAGHSRQH